jgi:hypothetical protein
MGLPERRALLANCHDQFAFVLVVGCLRGVGDCATPLDRGTAEFREKEGSFAVWIFAHLAGVGRVVASDTEDPADGKASSIADNRDGGWI